MQVYIISLGLALCLSGCSLSRTGGSNLNNDRLDGCPSSPNCVSSEALDAEHAVAPLHLTGDPQKAWKAITKIVGQMPRHTIVEHTNHYLHVECKSRLFRFVDDLELLLDPATMVIAIRSAARVGKSDLGVNRRRVEALRKKLKEDGLIE
jgi:uncharacterized protein (DUF1499 family)